ncbi:MAG: sugar phosphorylase [Candidatus Marinimicrobia bacterium]|nr:sugar phosphorylase [Candidatus Neomarinimicrobiota bacterium]
MQKIRGLLTQLYGSENVESILNQIINLIENYRHKIKSPSVFTESDIALICYGDSFRSPGKPPLQSLHEFLIYYLDCAVSIVHLLPFFPFSSDDGFSVIDYKLVDPDLGDWTDIENLGQSYGLIIDAVVNHISAKSKWFQEYLKDNPDYANFFIETNPSIELSSVIRARAHPLLTKFNRNGGEIHLWTTFSADQIDLNFQNPIVLIKMLDVLLYYASKSARILRLDAIGHAWKKPGTTCLNLPETHCLVQLFCAVLNMVFPNVQLLTETNVPHEENIRYFGDGTNEAQLVYQFSLPGLVIHSFLTGNSVKLTEWAKTLTLNSDNCTYFNLLASHDGIGIRPLLGILDASEIDNLVQTTLNLGGFVSYKNSTADGQQDPYELNITLYDILAEPDQSKEMNIRKFINVHAILLTMQGIPAIYYHSLFASSGDHDGVKTSGQNRSINRKKLNLMDLDRELSDPQSRASKVLTEIKQLIGIRKRHPAFNPYSHQEIHSLSEQLFCVERTSKDRNEKILAIHNLSDKLVEFSMSESSINNSHKTGNDLVTNRHINLRMPLFLAPYEFIWLKLSWVSGRKI